MRLKGFFFILMTLQLFLFGNDGDRVLLVHNSAQEIENCTGKLKLELIRVWGGDKEEDENKFFKTPNCVAIDSGGDVYICDHHSHCIKVFDSSGKYLRTISRRGKGPGDLLAPYCMTLTPADDIIVLEMGGVRIQRFSPEGKSKKIIKVNFGVGWVGVTSKNELLFYNSRDSFRSQKVISLLDSEGRKVREIGTHHDDSKSYLSAEKLIFTTDNQDNIYAANMWTPVIRKYSTDGKMLLAITFASPFEVPNKVTLNSRGDDIEKIGARTGDDTIRSHVTKKGDTISIQQTQQEYKFKQPLFYGLGTDAENRIYVVTPKRLLTEEEASKTGIMWTVNGLVRKYVDYDIVENLDFLRLVVFDSSGKVIAKTSLRGFCDGIYIWRNRILLIDGRYNQRILEYKITLEH